MVSFRAKILRRVMKKGLNFNKSLTEIRKDFEKLSTSLKVLKNINIEKINKEVKGELITPKNAPQDQIVYFVHGGGNCLGLYNSTRNHIIRVAKLINKKVLILDFRVAPENPYPAGFNDTVAGYQWLINNNYSPKNIYFYGESAGCSLILNALTELRDNNKELPACSFFSTPFLDYTMNGNTIRSNASKDPYYCDKKFYISNYYVGKLKPSDPKISPIFGDLHNLPPFLIHGAEYDMLLYNSIDFYEKIRVSGGKAELKIWKKLWHVFHINSDIIPEGKKAIKEFGVYIDKFK